MALGLFPRGCTPTWPKDLHGLVPCGLQSHTWVALRDTWEHVDILVDVMPGEAGVTPQGEGKVL